MEPTDHIQDQHSNEYYVDSQRQSWYEETPVGSPKDERNDWNLKQRRNTIQSHSHPVTVPTGEAGQRQISKQQHPDYPADLAQPYHRVPGTDSRPRSRTVLESGWIPTGQSVTTTVPATIPRMRHTRRTSYTAVTTSPPINSYPPSSTTTNTGRIGSARAKRHTITDAPRHTRRISRSANVLMAAATSQPIDPSPMWADPTLFSGRGVRNYNANMVMPETPSALSHYQYDAGRPDINCAPPPGLTYRPILTQDTFPDQTAPPEVMGTGYSAAGNPANSRRLNGIGAVSISAYVDPRSSAGHIASLQRSPVSTLADRHPPSHGFSYNQHDDHYGNIPSGSRYPTQDNFDYHQISHQADVNSMPSHLQQQQAPEAVYGSGAHYYRSSRSPASPMMPIRSSPQQALYQPYTTASNLTVTPFSAPGNDIIKINHVSYIPPQSHLQSPLPAMSPPSEISELERRSPTLQSRSRVPGQRVDVDTKMLEASFQGTDEQSQIRRRVLDDIQQQPWFHYNRDEPKMDIHAHRDILKHGLGMVGRSIYTVFLVEDKESNQWKCLFGSENQSCKKSTKRFERVERAIEHVRSHLGHRPFACDGSCHKSKSTGATCGKRFFAAGYLEDHKKRPQKRANGSQWYV